MFRSTFIKKISISWLSQHNSNNFTSSKFLFIYIFPSQIPQAFPLSNDHWKSSNTFKIFLSKRSIHYEIYKPKNSQFPYPQPYQLYHFTSISYISFLLISKIHSIPWYIRPFTRCSSSSSIVPPFIPRIEEERFRYRRAPNSKTRSIVGQFTITGVILPRHQASISSIAAQTHTHAHTHPRRWSTRYRSRGKRSQPIGDDRSGSIFRLDRGRGGEWRERSLLGRLIRWSFDTWRGACISAVWSASPPRYALLALFSQGCRWVFFSPSEPGRGGSVSRGIWKRENFWSGWKKRCNYFFW